VGSGLLEMGGCGVCLEGMVRKLKGADQDGSWPLMIY